MLPVVFMLLRLNYGYFINAAEADKVTEFVDNKK